MGGIKKQEESTKALPWEWEEASELDWQQDQKFPALYTAQVPSSSDMFREVEESFLSGGSQRKMLRGFKISRVVAVRNETLSRSFASALDIFEYRRSLPSGAFNTNTGSGGGSAGAGGNSLTGSGKSISSVASLDFAQDEKETAIARLKAHFVSQHKFSRANVLTAWHGCTQEVAHEVSRTGAANLRRTDGGWFGSGIYLTPQAGYAAGYAMGLFTGSGEIVVNADDAVDTDTETVPEISDDDKGSIVAPGTTSIATDEFALLKCYVAVGNVYPVTRQTDYAVPDPRDVRSVSRYHWAYPVTSEDDLAVEEWNRKDKALRAGFDAHWIGITARRPWNYQASGSAAAGACDYEELVVAEERQMLPRFIVYFRRDDDYHGEVFPETQVAAQGDDADLKTLLSHISMVESPTQQLSSMLSSHEASGRRRIAIIGAGIGGAACAFHVSQLLPGSQITVYERDTKPGGRLDDVEIYGALVELGGAVFHAVNVEMRALAQAAGVEVKAPREMHRREDVTHSTTQTYSTLPGVGVFNGDEFVLTIGGGGMGDLVKLIWRYGLNPLKTSWVTNTFKKQLAAVYENKTPFLSIQDFLDRGGLDQYSTKAARGLGLGDKFGAECLAPICRTIYGQGVDVNGYAGLVTVVAADSAGLYSCKAGNKSLPAALLERSGARLKTKTSVKHVVAPGACQPHSPYRVQLEGDDESTWHEFDAVVVATPLAGSNIEITSGSHDVVDLQRIASAMKSATRPYRRQCVTLVKGILNPTYFGMGTTALVPDVILTTEHDAYDCDDDGKAATPSGGAKFYSLTALKRLQSGNVLYKFFSPVPIEDAEIAKIFHPGYEVAARKDWEHCFPDLSPSRVFPPVTLSKKMFYINAIESLAPSMEAVALAAHNVSKLLAQEFGVNANT